MIGKNVISAASVALDFGLATHRVRFNRGFMTDNTLALPSPNALFLPTAGDANARSSIKRFVTWMDTRRVHWTQADLSDYRDYLLYESGLSVYSICKSAQVF
jgi:hypothetical protein